MTELERILRKELYKKSFYDFVVDFWHTCEPNKMIQGNIIKIYCEIFQYMCKDWIGYDNKIINVPKINEDQVLIDVRQNKHNLCLMVPPRHTKSLIFNVMGPTWLWTYYPIKAASISHNGSLAGQMNSKRYAIVNSELYKEIYTDIYLVANTSTFIKDHRGGELYSLNRNAFTGFGCDCCINDDLSNAETARKDQAEMSNVWAYYQNTMPSRINDINKCIVMNIQQRLAPNDVAGHIMSDPKLADTYVFVTLPAIFEKETFVVCPISGDVIHYNVGDYLWPERFGDYSALRYQVGESIFQTQYLQKPISSDRTVIKPDMIHEKDSCNVPSIDDADMVYVSTDFPVKDKETSDFLGSVLAYRVNKTLYIVDCLEKRMAFVKGVEYIQKIEELYPGSIKICEDKANGSSTIQLLQDTVSGIQAFNPGVQSKMQRLESASYYINNVVFVRDNFAEDQSKYLLSESLENLKQRLLAFPFVEHDDIVDAFSMLLLFVFLDKKFEVYGRAFNDQNLIDCTDKIRSLQSTVFFNKEGDLWKTCEIAIDYKSESDLIIRREATFKASVEDGLMKLHEKYPTASVFIDASYFNSLDGLYNKHLVITRYEDSDFDKSVATINKLFATNRIKVCKECLTTRADIEMFKYAKTKDETIRYATEKDGMVACIRIAAKYYGVY